MSKIAIDVVLLPDDKMTEKVIEISAKQSNNYNGKILLNKNNCLPHISLAMGVISQEDIFKIVKILERISLQFKIFNLEADEYTFPSIPSGEIVSNFSVKKTDELQSLHEIIIKEIKTFFSYDITVDMMYSPPKVEELSLYWIKNFLKNSSYDKFRPHITIGFGKEKNIDTPIKFSAPALALCHLGNYCTCRKILHLIKLIK